MKVCESALITQMAHLLSNLPQDIFLLISESLTLSDLLRLACTCSSLNFTASESAHLVLLSRHPSAHVALVEACRAGHLPAAQALTRVLMSFEEYVEDVERPYVSEVSSDIDASEGSSGNGKESRLSGSLSRPPQKGTGKRRMRNPDEASVCRVSSSGGGAWHSPRSPSATAAAQALSKDAVSSDLVSTFLLSAIAASQCGSGATCGLMLHTAADRVRLKTTPLSWHEAATRTLLPSATEALCIASHIGRRSVG